MTNLSQLIPGKYPSEYVMGACRINSMKMKKQIILTAMLFGLLAPAAKAQFSIAVNGGYHSLKYAVKDGKNAIAPGAGIDFGYTKPFRNKHWALYVGMGANYYNTSATLNSGTSVTANQVDDMGAGFEYRVVSKQYEETQHMIGVGIPLYIQLSPGKQQKMNWYINVGPKFIFPLQVNVKASAEQLNLQGYYPDVNLLVNNEIPQHGFGTVYNWSGKSVKLLNPGLAISAGTGLRFPLKNGSHLITGLLFDYGVTDMKKQNNQALVSYNAPIASGTAANSVMATSNAGKIIPFSVCLRIGYEFGPHKKKVKAPLIDMDALGKIINPPLVDGDKDGVPDKLDDCPCVAGPVCYKGCPDTDGDGVLDKDDHCPDVKGLKKYNGCPVPDTDGDGVNDEDDKCPTIPGLAKLNGCPAKDEDNDGVPDDEDLCPKVSGSAKNHGCPEIAPELVKKVKYAADNILFQTGTATLMSSSFRGLNDVVEIMQENGGVQLKIDGHTDYTGSDSLNDALSQNRANAVKQYIVSKGIDESRMAATGYGKRKPVAPNNTPEGRRQNRRVELKLLYE